MPLRPKTLPTPAHWSKDFVEHLRTVHFALIATAVTLVIVAITTKPYSTSAAARELRQIQDLRTNWSQKFIHDKLKHQNYYSPVYSKSEFFLIDPNQNKAHWTLYLQIMHDNTIYEVSFDEGLCDCGPNGRTEIPTPPETVTGFGAWWDRNFRLGVCYFGFPNRLGTPTVDREGIKHTQDIVFLLRGKGGSELTPEELHELAIRYRVQHVAVFTSFDGSADVLQYVSLRDKTLGTLTLEVVLPVPEFYRSEVSVNSISSYMGIKPGRFHESFRDLEEVAKANGVESLAALQETLSKVELSDSPVFEAFGIKFPADVATIGGTVVLLSVQLYFFIYLRKLFGALKEEDEGWNVPWIGMDTSTVAKASSWTTIVVFPIASLLVLGTASAMRLTRGYWGYVNGRFHLAPISGFHWTVDLKLIAMIVAIILSVYLGSMSWKYRPQMAVSALPKPPEEDSVEPSGKADQPKPDPNKVQEVDQN